MRGTAGTVLILVGGLTWLALGLLSKEPGPATFKPQMQPNMSKDELILTDGKIWTGERNPDGKTRIAQAVAIAGGRFIAVGDNHEALAYQGESTRVIRLGGKRVVPGFIDSHVHFIGGGLQLLSLDLKNVRSEEEFVRRIGEKASTLPPGRWLKGGGWDEEDWPSRKLPTRWQIDRVTPANPVYLRRYDGHAALANSLALKLAGISRETLAPSDGVIVADPATGEPTGVLKDGAMGLVAKAIPRASEAEMEEALRAALGEAGRMGVTSVHNITLDEQTPSGSFWSEVDLFRRAEQQGWLTVRQYLIIPIQHVEELARAAKRRKADSDWVRLRAVKGFADGSLGSATAWMFEPFDDVPESRGLPMELMDPPAEMESLVRTANQAGIQACIHAIGDRAVAETLDVFDHLSHENSKDARFRIEHAQHVRPGDFPRFAKLGVIASMQPFHAIDDGRWAERRIGAQRARTSYAWRSMLKAGARLAFGSDWPVAPLNPMQGIYAAVTRATLDGKHPKGWYASECLTVEEALHAYTTGGALAAFEEGEKGTISVGKLADMSVLSQDILEIAPERISEIEVKITISGGKVVFEKD